MSEKKPVIEIVKSRAKNLVSAGGMVYEIQWHVRVKAPNGRIIMSSETYKRKRTAVNAANYAAAALRVSEVNETGD